MENFIDTFGGNGYVVGSGNILPRYYPEDGDKVCLGKDEDGKKILVDSVSVIFYGLRQVRLNQYDFKTKKKFPKCFSTNFIKPTGGEEKQAVESCAACPLKDWGEDEAGKRLAPECSEVIETIVYDVNSKGFALIQWKKTGFKVWKYIEKTCFVNLSKMQSFDPRINPLQQFVWKLESKQTETSGIEHAIFKPSIERELQPERKKQHAIAAGGAYKYLLLRDSSELLLEAGQDYEDRSPRQIAAAPVAPPPITFRQGTPEENAAYEKAFPDAAPTTSNPANTPAPTTSNPAPAELPEENPVFKTLEQHNEHVANKGIIDEPPF